MPEPVTSSEKSNYGLGCLPLLVMIMLIVFVVLIIIFLFANSFAQVSLIDSVPYDEIERYLPELIQIFIYNFIF